jgi:hypothetical protein
MCNGGGAIADINNLVNEDILHTPESIEGRVKGMFG